MFRAAVSCCLVLAAFGVTAARGETAPCSAPEILFSAAPPAPGTIPPRPKQWPIWPHYPASLGTSGPSGVVFADFIVERDGHKCNVRINIVDGPKQFGETVSAWLAATEFSPGLVNGKPVVAEVKRMYNFSPAPKRR